MIPELATIDFWFQWLIQTPNGSLLEPVQSAGLFASFCCPNGWNLLPWIFLKNVSDVSHTNRIFEILGIPFQKLWAFLGILVRIYAARCFSGFHTTTRWFFFDLTHRGSHWRSAGCQTLGPPCFVLHLPCVGVGDKIPPWVIRIDGLNDVFVFNGLFMYLKILLKQKQLKRIDF